METNLTRAECRRRSDDVTLSSYRVEIDVSECTDPGVATFPTTSHIDLASRSGQVTLDFIGEVTGVEVDGERREVDADGARVRVEVPAGRSCTLTVRGNASYSRSGEGMHRFVDPADQRVYLYTQYEPSDSRRVFPCFEQPDLKAEFTFAVTGPDDWEIRSNGAEVSRDATGDNAAGMACSTRTFATTPPQSTYLTCVIAGPYRRWDDSWSRTIDGAALEIPLALLCRESLASAFDPETLFALTKEGLEHFHDRFAHPYPWGKYDQIFVPEYNLGAMENPGLVTFADESYVYESAATRSQLEGRSNTLMHEMSHMWFGDLVTPVWWDELWLKESFADYMGTAANALATEYTDAWTPFCARRKAWAYEQDQLPTTHPIVADIPDIEAARQNFDGITYAKGASVLKQLVAYVGTEEFYAGARRYFREHAFSSTTLPDLLAPLEEASGRDLGPWVEQWLHTTGVSELTPRVTLAEDGTIAELAIDQAGSGENGDVWRDHRLVVGLYERAEDDTLHRTSRLELDVSGEVTVVAEATGLPAPALVVVNDDDLTYAKVRLDPQSHATLRETFAVESSLTRACLWSSLWQSCRDALLPAAEYVDLVCRHAPGEGHVALLAGALANAVVAARDYAPPAVRAELERRLLDFCADRMRAAEPGSGVQLVFARVFADVALSCDARAEEIRAILDGEEQIEGLPLDSMMRWSLWRALAATGHATIDDLDAERARDTSSPARIRHLTAVASRPDAATKAADFAEVVDDSALSNEEVSARTVGFSTPGHGTLTQRYLEPYLEALLPVWRSRSQELATRMVKGFFPAADLTPGGRVEEHPVVVAIRGWLAADEDAPAALRRLLVERLALLERALRAQAAA
ncbi:aminopeptidase N [Mobilicoccus sp.]|uniref:aminopeptidase N n=1 Tax=Mobilicoccus sp. TaxID=2034349 RepID=UPI0028AC38E5|nr:aminopeptidase N [Mobilicoccus sp.]